MYHIHPALLARRHHVYVAVDLPTGSTLARRLVGSAGEGIALLSRALDLHGREVARLRRSSVVETPLGHYAHCLGSVRDCYCHSPRQHDRGGPGLRAPPVGAHLRLAVRHAATCAVVRDERYASAAGVTRACLRAGLPRELVTELFVTGCVLTGSSGAGVTNLYLSWCRCGGAEHPLIAV